jgi:uncharacterized membrane protein YfcA
MPVAGTRFMEARRYNFRASIGLAVGGIPGVPIAACIVKSLPLAWLRWLVVLVVAYAALTMLSPAHATGPRLSSETLSVSALARTAPRRQARRPSDRDRCALPLPSTQSAQAFVNELTQGSYPFDGRCNRIEQRR